MVFFGGWNSREMHGAEENPEIQYCRKQEDEWLKIRLLKAATSRCQVFFEKKKLSSGFIKINMKFVGVD